ncbi:MAG: tRNA uracil 4-sulfurtransferase ThiI [Candidatus Micrarchaeaceae archaeon]
MAGFPYQIIDIRYGELWLKGKNRPRFINQLVSNIEEALKGEEYSNIEKLRDRIIIRLLKSSNGKRMLSKLSKVFGISAIYLGITCAPTLEAMLAASSTLASRKKSIRIEARRSYKLHSFTSIDIRNYIMQNQDRLSSRADSSSHNKLYIDALKHFAIVSDTMEKGAGGLPVGSSGTAVALLSGGIDSPLAAYMAMKRGLRLVYVHFHAFPDNSSAMKSKISSIIKVLSEYGSPKAVYYVPSHIFQAYAASAKSKYELLIFKHFIYVFASAVAARENAKAIVTGESLGQVASQTVENLLATQNGVEMLILRPLIGMDKQEIIDMASRIGTYRYSIMQYRDVCSIKSRRPATSASASAVSSLYKKLKMDLAVGQSLAKATKE